jgi:hypothetical protein
MRREERKVSNDWATARMTEILAEHNCGDLAGTPLGDAIAAALRGERERAEHSLHARISDHEIYRELLEARRREKVVEDQLTSERASHPDARKMRLALIDAAMSLNSYEASCGQGYGSTEAREIINLLGYDGGDHDDIDDCLRALRNALPVAARGAGE